MKIIFKNGLTRLLIIVLSAVASLPAMGQRMPCILVTTNADTLIGTYVNADQNGLLLKWGNNQTVKFSLQQVHEYALLQADGTAIPYQYIIQLESGQRKPMRRLVDGKWKLYLDKVPFRSSVNPGLPKNAAVTHYTMVYYLSSDGVSAIKTTERTWKTLLQERMADCAMLMQHLGRNGYQFKDLPAIVAAYNAYVRQETINDKRAVAPPLFQGK